MLNTNSTHLAAILNRIAITSRRKLSQQSDKFRLAGELIHLCDQAITLRDGEMIKQASCALSLLDLPPKYEAISEYYEAMAERQFDPANRENANRRICLLTGSPSLRANARALITNGIDFVRSGRLDEFAYTTKEANRLIVLDGDHLGLVYSSMNTAAVLSMEGNHRDALSLLESIFPVIRQMAIEFPGLYASYMNYLAIEYAAYGDLKRADDMMRRVLSTPFAGRFPEWQETATDIRLQLRGASRSVIFTGDGIVMQRPVPETLPVAPRPVSYLAEYKAKREREQANQAQMLIEKQYEVLTIIYADDATPERLDRMIIAARAED